MDNDGNGRETPRATGPRAHHAQNIAHLAVVGIPTCFHHIGSVRCWMKSWPFAAIEKPFADVFRRGQEGGSIRAENTSIAIKGGTARELTAVCTARARTRRRQAKDRAELATLQVEGVA